MNRLLILRMLPLKLISSLCGRLVAVVLPQPFRSWILRIFAWFYEIDLSVASQPLGGYKSIADLFIRDLKAGVRAIGAGLLSPVDGCLRNCGDIKELRALQVKGISYSLQELLGGSELLHRFQRGSYLHFYLSPPDYHHVHAPLSGRVVGVTHIPGALWPVNDIALNGVAGLYAKNERVITYLESDRGLLAVVMVGALNVGSMSLTFDPELRTNTARGFGQRNYTPPPHLTAGARLGTFHMGSAVVLLTEMHIDCTLLLPTKVIFGQSITS